MSHQAPKPKRVAIYSRWTSKRPQLSLAGQLAVMRKYAKRHGFMIVATYADGTKGGNKA